MSNLHILTSEERSLLKSILHWSEKKTSIQFDHRDMRAYIRSALTEYIYSRWLPNMFYSIDQDQINFNNNNTESGTQRYLQEKLKVLYEQPPIESIARDSVLFFLLEKFKSAHRRGDIYNPCKPHPNDFLPVAKPRRLNFFAFNQPIAPIAPIVPIVPIVPIDRIDPMDEEMYPLAKNAV